eukprot:scaffold8216_cov47-Phaeocystis_antarctica.AAC.3
MAEIHRLRLEISRLCQRCASGLVPALGAGRRRRGCRARAGELPPHGLRVSCPLLEVPSSNARLAGNATGDGR